MLRISPSERLYVDVQPNGTPTDNFVMLSNIHHGPILFKVQARSDHVSAAHITAVNPKNGLLMPDKNQKLRVTSAANGSRGDDACEDWLPVVSKVIIQYKAARESRAGHNDKSTSLWNTSDDSDSDHTVQTHEIDVLINFKCNAETTLRQGGATLHSSSLLNVDSPPFQSRISRMDYSGGSDVVSGIQDLVASNEMLRNQVIELEELRDEDASKLIEARKEANDAKMASHITSHLLKQVEDLKEIKLRLEEEIDRLRMEDLERREILIEKDAKLQKLSVENNKLYKENVNSRDRKDETFNFLDQSTDSEGVVASRQDKNSEVILPPKITPRRTPLRSRPIPDELTPRSRTRESHFESLTARFSDVATTKSEGAANNCVKDENLLFFLKHMTLLFAALTILAAINIFYTDFM